MIAYKSYHKSKPRSYALAVFIVLLALFLSFSAFNDLFGVRFIFSSASYPFKFVTLTAVNGVAGFSSSIINLRNAQKENEALKKELDELKPKLMLLDEIVAENEGLRLALDYRKASHFWFNLLPAQIVGRSAAPWFTMLEVNRGRKAGVKENMAVINREGLVGRVVEVSEFSSKVMLISDGKSAVSAKDVRSQDFGVVEGNLPDRLYMRYVSAGGDIQVGDKIITSPLSTDFPPGILLGAVSNTSKREHDLFYRIEIKPAVDFSKIADVFLIL